MRSPGSAFDLREALCEEVRGAIQALEGGDGGKKAVHAARVRLKRARALARVGHAFAPGLAAVFNDSARAIMSSLAEARNLAALAKAARAAGQTLQETRREDVRGGMRRARGRARAGRAHRLRRGQCRAARSIGAGPGLARSIPSTDWSRGPARGATGAQGVAQGPFQPRPGRETARMAPAREGPALCRSALGRGLATCKAAAPPRQQETRQGARARARFGAPGRQAGGPVGAGRGSKRRRRGADGAGARAQAPNEPGAADCSAVA